MISKNPEPPAGRSGLPAPWATHARNFVEAALAHRRLLACALAACALALLVERLSPEPARLVPVVVATADLPVGTVLEPGHVKVQEFPRELAPHGPAVRQEELVGQTLSSPAQGGQVLSPRMTVSGVFRQGVPEGRVAVPVTRVEPGLATLLEAGMRVDLVDRGAGWATVAQDSVMLVVGPPDGPGGTSVVVAVKAEEAGAVAEALKREAVAVIPRPTNTPGSTFPPRRDVAAAGTGRAGLPFEEAEAPQPQCGGRSRWYQ